MYRWLFCGGRRIFYVRKPNELNIPDNASQKYKKYQIWLKDYIKHYMLILKYINSYKNNRNYAVNICQ